MGQKVSKAAASRLGRAAAARSAVVEETTTGAATSSTASQPASKQVPRTHPSNTAGFQRGESSQIDVRDALQREFLQGRAAAGKSTAGTTVAPTEMPDDLVQFLKGAGPLQKKEVKSSKVTGESKQPTESAPAEASAVGSKRRRREMMPLAANVEGFGTERTTNFSYDDASPAASSAASEGVSPKSDEEEGMFDVLDLYRLLKLSPDDPELTNIRDPDVKQRVVDAQRYLEVPVVVKESDEDGYIGVHKETLATLSVPPVPKSIVKLVLEDIVESRSKSERSQSQSQG